MKIKIDDGTCIVTAIPDGYRRVVNGYTRQGDLVYAPIEQRTHYGEWEPVDELQLVSEFYAVIRPKQGESVRGEK